MAVFLIVGLAVYCYRQHVSATTHSIYAQSALNSHAQHHPLYSHDHTPDLDTVEEDLLGKQML